MLQAVVKKGKVIGEKVFSPKVSDGCVLIKVVNSCISAGTELTSVNASGKSLIQKAKEKPEKIKMAFNLAKSKGLKELYKAVHNVTESMSPVGYSISGVVLAMGSGVTQYNIGDKVAAAGAGIANHAEFVDVPENLVVKIPQYLDFKRASTITLGGIALQGVRRADLRLGEFCVVTGAGILGLISLQLLRNSGIRVAVIDLDERRLSIAEKLGAEIIINPTENDAVKDINSWTGGYGTDAVIFTAATSNSQPLSDAFKMCKRKGRVILVGVSGMEIKREDIYPKELDFMISTSYGPGRYDKNYEEKGLEYPYAYVRWTENRNMAEYLRLLSHEEIDLSDIIEKDYSIKQVTEAFESLNVTKNKPLMVILSYGNLNETEVNKISSIVDSIELSNKVCHDKINVALVGTGAFVKSMHLPNLEKLSDKYNIYAIVEKDGLKAKAIGKQYKAAYVTSDYNKVLEDKNVDLVMISTQHGTHAEMVLEALKHGKNVFVEKPLATKENELQKIISFYENATLIKPALMVGFNRRFSKYSVEIKTHTQKRINPLFIHYRMNAGYIPLEHWVHENGGRIVGEGCHIIDLMSYFTESEIESISSESLEPTNEKLSSCDNKSIILKYKDGSVCTIEYFSNGSKDFPKEYMEVHFDEKTIVMKDYKSLKGYGVKVNEIQTENSEKGHVEELVRLHEYLSGLSEVSPIQLRDMFQTTKATFIID